MSAALEVRGLSHRYPRGWLGRPGPPALAEVSLSLAPGEVLGLVGESGSGKSTLVRCVAGLMAFDAGEIRVLGEALDRRRPRPRPGLVQVLFQDVGATLNPRLSLEAHLLESARLHQRGTPPGPLVEDLAARLGLGHRLGALPGQLSGGELRRAGVARALLARPRLLIADEPTAGLDAALKADLIDLLVEGRGQGRATLLVSHDLHLVAWACDHIAVLHEGRVVDRLPAGALHAPERHPFTRALLDDAGLGPAPESP